MPNLYQVAKSATDIFCTFSGDRPETVDIGIPELRKRVGPLFRGNTVVIGAAQGVGKTSFVLSMLSLSEDIGGVASGEDDEDVWGCRVLAGEARVDPTAIRRGTLGDDEKDRVTEALTRLRGRLDSPVVVPCIGAGLDRLTEVADNLARNGCKFGVLDYIQKFRGIHGERRHEVSNVLAHWHKVCSERGMVPVALSQVVRMEATTEPHTWHLKESGDLENEARLIILLWRDPTDHLIVRAKIAKSSFGGGGHRFAYRFDDNEVLEPYTPPEDPYLDEDF